MVNWLYKVKSLGVNMVGCMPFFLLLEAHFFCVEGVGCGGVISMPNLSKQTSVYSQPEPTWSVCKIHT